MRHTSHAAHVLTSTGATPPFRYPGRVIFRDPSPVLALLRQHRGALPAIASPVCRLTVELTKYCSVGCSFCKYNAPLPRLSEKRPSLYLNQEAIDACITYIAATGVQQVVLTGGGEPTHEFETVLRIIKEASSSVFSLYTAGQWGATDDDTSAILNALQSAVARRNRPAEVRIRLSLDRFHQQRIGLTPALNIISTLTKFPDRYPDLRISIRTVIGHDHPVAEVADRLGIALEPVDQHLSRLLMPGGRPIEVMAFNLIPTGRYNTRSQGFPELSNFKATLAGLQSHLGQGWPLSYAGGLNIGIRPSGKVYLYGATPENLGEIPKVDLATAIERLARDPISHAIHLEGIVSFFDALAACEKDIVALASTHHEPSLLIPKFCETQRGLLLTKLVALVLISERIRGASSVLAAIGLDWLTHGSKDARLLSLSKIYEDERNDWK